MHLGLEGHEQAVAAELPARVRLHAEGNFVARLPERGGDGSRPGLRSNSTQTQVVKKSFLAIAESKNWIESTSQRQSASSGLDCGSKTGVAATMTIRRASKIA